MEGLLAAVGVVVLVGAVAGNLYASRRRAAPRVQVYSAAARHLRSGDGAERTPGGVAEAGVYGAIANRLDEAEPEEDGAGLWDRLAGRVDPAAYRPKLRPDVEVKTFKLRWGNDYAMIANPTDLLHYQLSVQDVPLLELMDGTRTVRDIVVERFQESGDMELEGAVGLVRELRTGNFLTDRYVDVRDIVKRAAHPESLARAKTREFVKTLSIEWTGAHRLVDWFYRRFVRFFFRPVLGTAAAIVAAVGLVAFFAVARSGRFELGGGSAAAQTFILLGMDYVLTFIHELGHAVVLVHHGRKVKSAGFMLYFGSPSFFVESSEVLMLDRKERISQAAAGPYAELIVSGIATMFIWAFPDAGVSPFLYTWAVINYFVIFMNLIPLLELDGYFILADLIQVPDLRPRSLRFIRYELWRKLRRREHMTRQELGLALYGILGVAFTILSVFTAFFFWKTIFGGLIASLWNGGLLGRVLLIALALFLAGPIIRGAINLARSIAKKIKGWADAIRFRLETDWRVEAAEMIDASPMFGDLPEDALSDLAGRVALKRYPAGKPVFRQGERPSAFYVVRRGRLDVVEEDEQTGKERVIRTLERGQMFGELGLVDGAPRSATVRPVEDADLFEIDESTFDRLLSDTVHIPDLAPTLQQAAELRALPPFASFGSEAIAELLQHGRWIAVSPGEAVVEEGEEGDAFYVIGSGQAEVLQGDELIRALGPGAHFGELALLMRIPRTATVVARTPLRVFRLDREAFDDVVAGAFRRGVVAAAPVERTAQH